MAIEHSCHCCGEALGGIAAPRDPRLGLCVVVCPRCQTACVRRRHPLVKAWRTFCMLFWGAYAMAWRSAVILALAWLSLLVTYGVRESLDGFTLRELAMHLRGSEDFHVEYERWFENYGPQLLLLYAAWCVLMGTAASGAAAHVRARWKVWLTIFALPWALIGFGYVFHVARLIDLNVAPGANLIEPSFHEERLFFAGGQIVGWFLAPLGIPIGRALRRASIRREQRRWIKKLARARKRRLEG